MWLINAEQKNKFLNKIKEHKLELITLGLILVVGIFLRTWNFSAWLHFEIDQVYDIDIVAPAVENGIWNLPLLGPNVGGGMLRLGPAFYYLQYLSAMIFGNTPTGHAMSVLLLSILALPLFYLFVRKFFSKVESLGLLAIFATSLYSVMYARFSWSPNVLPFLMLLSSYALLRAVSGKEKHPARWFLLAVFVVAVTSQIHFNSFFIAPLIAVAFTIIKRPKFPWKVWLAGLGIVFLVYAPVILNDLKTNGENLSYLQEKFRKTKPNNMLKKHVLMQTAQYTAYQYFFINTGQDFTNGIKLKDSSFSCATCREQLGLKIFSLALFGLSSLILLFKLFFTEKDPEKKNFLLLTAIWSLASFYLVYSIADGYRMYPRFFLASSPLAIFSMGLLLQFIFKIKNKLSLLIFALIIALLVGLNLKRLFYVANQLQSEPATLQDKIDTGDVFPATNRITLAEQQAVVDYIKEKSQANNYPVYLDIASEYAPNFWYLLEKNGIHYFNDVDKKKTYTQANYFSLTYAANTTRSLTNLQEKEFAIFGKLRISRLEPSKATDLAQPLSEKKMRYDLKVMSELLTWKKLFN